MEGYFRNVLIIISAVIIGAIFVHGLWTIRKNKNPYKLKASKQPAEPFERDFDRAGFDQDGVSQPRVVKSTQEEAKPAHEQSTAGQNIVERNIVQPIQEARIEASNEDILPTPPEQTTTQTSAHSIEASLSQGTGQSTAQSGESELASTSNEAYEQKSKAESITNEASVDVQEPSFGSLDFDLGSPELEAELEPELTARADKQRTIAQPSNEAQEPNPFTIKEDAQVAEKTAIRKARIEQPVYAEPVTHAKPARKRESKAQALKRNQMEINFGDEAAAPKENKAPTIESEPIVLSVVVGENQIMSGAVLLPTLLTLGMKFGEMNIFHRHEDNAGNGKITFSLANMLNPGTFDLDSMETFVTQGVTLFMTLPNEGDPFEVYSQMLAAAKHLAQEFNGQVLDEKRSVMTKQTEQHYMSKIREFDRKSRIAAL